MSRLIIIAFVDKEGGMMFNHRRQSKDSVALQKIIDMTAGSVLWVNEYTASLFGQFDVPQLKADAGFLSKAEPGEFCLVEEADILPFSCFIEKIILFHWNRDYPRDKKFPLDVHSGKWHCTSQEDFTGSSHEKITMEVYER